MDKWTKRTKWSCYFFIIAMPDFLDESLLLPIIIPSRSRSNTNSLWMRFGIEFFTLILIRKGRKENALLVYRLYLRDDILCVGDIAVAKDICNHPIKKLQTKQAEGEPLLVDRKWCDNRISWFGWAYVQVRWSRRRDQRYRQQTSLKYPASKHH